jgi:hypothetical protein
MSNPNDITVNAHWQDMLQFKIPTALKYDESFNLISWGYPALSQRPNRIKKSCDIDIKPVENFLLYLSKTNYKPYLPEGLDYKKAITDYLKQMGDLIKDTISARYRDIEFFKNVLIVMPVIIIYLY